MGSLPGNTQLTGKVALVTGGSRGIGAGIAKRLALDGAKVAITYSKGKDAARGVVREIEEAGGKALAIQADAADPAAVRNAVEKTVEALGRLDILVNNAGVYLGTSLKATTLEQFDQVFNVNVRGLYFASQTAAEYLSAGGRIINVGSIAGERAPFPNMSVYAGSKGAVKMITQSLARELGPRGITVNNVQPGPIYTDMATEFADPEARKRIAESIPALRFGQVDDLGPLVSFLAGPSASFINGANLTVDGGTIA